MAQMQASTVEQIAQLKAEAVPGEAEALRKYDKLQLQLKAEAAARDAEEEIWRLEISDSTFESELCLILGVVLEVLRSV
ncbi:hypothetical protein J1N35_041736 [Gossypium stocksii]|uniref:Uncharacterized protein n=1 Tax=Gossypium stocksii TaxID=47602 RepID=A0A9D3UGI3_9ROSI|nr:hypothetical protein J1N35_041736 [Gossypium stocksii]